MLGIDDETRRQRRRDESTRDALDRLADPEGPGENALVCVTTTVAAAYPTVAARWYAVQPLVVTGPEAEGGTVSTSSSANKYLAANVGKGVPAIGTKVIVVAAGSKLVFQYDG